MKKNKGPIRTEAIIPFLIVALLTWAYFFMFFDGHLRRGLQFVGYQVVGAEVDIASLNTSFLKGTLRIQGIEITDPDKPTQNMVKIGDVRFGLLWDALLRAKFVVSEMAVEQIEVASPRKRPGKVKPPEVKSTKSDEPSALEREAAKLGGQATSAVKEKYEGNVLGDIAAMISGTSGEDQLKNIEGSLPSKAKLDQFEKELQTKSKQWEERLRSLPQGKELQALGDRLGKVKTKDFKTPQELMESLNQVDAILKEADAKYKAVQSAANDLDGELKSMDKELRNIDAMIKKDIQDLQARFRIPKIDAKSLSMGIFKQYLNPYISKVNRYKPMLQKYLPPKYADQLSGKARTPKEKQQEDLLQVHPRAKGIAYEFGRLNSYPLFWIKKISITSKATPNGLSGDLDGKITDITSNQTLIRRPTIAQLNGGFPSQGIQKLSSKLSIDAASEPSLVRLDFSIGAYPITGRSLVDSPDISIAFKKATGALSSSVQLQGLKNISLALNNKIGQIDYDINSKNEILKDIVQNSFNDVPLVTLDATGKGELPSVNLDINSNLGPALQKGFEKQISKKLEEAKAKLNAAINEAIGKEQARIQNEFNKAKNQIDGEIKKVNEQIEAQKKVAESKITQAKNDANAQADRERKKAEDEAKKKLADELKKRLGL